MCINYLTFTKIKFMKKISLLLVCIVVFSFASEAMPIVAPNSHYWEGFSAWWHNLWN